MQTSKYLLGTASVLALLASSAATPANAQATDGLYFGGSSLASEAFRQIFDCYTGATVGGDGYTFDATFPGPGKLPTTCTTAGPVAPWLQGMYAGVGSGNGFRGFISNKPYQWFSGSQVTTVAANTLINTPFPPASPPFVDSANSTNFGNYPYPRVDVGLSDSPLPGTLAALTTVAFSFTPTTNWSTAAGALAQITLNAATQVNTYSAGSWGNPVQLPAFAVNVAIPININSSLFVINSKIPFSGNPTTGGAIQLSGAQLCAIFSGLVTDWNSTASIPYRDDQGNLQTAPFHYTNVGNGVGTSQPYVASPNSLPIKVVYRQDGSGTSFIITNYLKAVCPLIDTANTYGYQSIFNTTNLPNNSFANLITNIGNFRGPGPWSTTTTVTTSAWVPATASGGVQTAVGTTSAGTMPGRIGYLSADFVKPYAINPDAPYAGSVQNENQRINTISRPATTGSSLTFIPPTPTSADSAWSDAALTPPATNSTWADWNVYGINFAATEPNHGGIAVAGKPVLPLTNRAGAYPLSGTAYLAIYSCQGNDTNGQNLIDFLNWFYQNTLPPDPNVPAIIRNNGFSPLNALWLPRVQNGPLSPGSGVAIALASGGSVNNDGCNGVTGGANP
ncbi:substrate-binding domain-containing protein [Bradyrhizobium sp. Ai1a-2]|uniref:substrate-binding domain-containing protein n=1 Tax=Bradyrhizobium sp. Ai1a-2 TaxID=196490 RepID=UPI0003F4FB61|nr:substrate-binding domain-containing protein [Bradyrhizobium sp. Ai1a-2]